MNLITKLPGPNCDGQILVFDDLVGLNPIDVTIETLNFKGIVYKRSWFL